jgi:hypothetical protein
MRPPLPALSLTGLALLSLPAWAGFPDDVSLSQLGTWDGAAFTDVNANRDAYQTVVRQLAAGVANQALQPAETLGTHGFAASLDSSWGFIDADHDDDDPSAWQRVHVDADPTRVLWVPTLTVRKGLPLSLEAGASVGYVGFSRQSVFGGFGRWGVWEGYRQFPDLTVKVGYSGLVGNDELELGVMDLSATLGYTVPFGTLNGIHDSTWSPWFSAGMLRTSASPRLSEAEQQALGIMPVSGSKSSESYQEGAGYAPFVGTLGFRIVTGDVTVTLAASTTSKAMPGLHMGFGFDF